MISKSVFPEGFVSTVWAFEFGFFPALVFLVSEQVSFVFVRLSALITWPPIVT